MNVLARPERDDDDKNKTNFDEVEIFLYRTYKISKKNETKK